MSEEAGFGKAMVKGEGKSYDSVSGKEVESPGYVYDPVDSARNDLYWAISRVEEALSSELGKSGVTTEYHREMLEQSLRDIRYVRREL